MNEQNRLPIKKDMYTEYKHIGPGPKDYEKTIVAPGHYRLTETAEYAKGDSSAEYEGCDFDEWKYYLDDKSGIGIVINYFYEQELEEPYLNVYVVPKDKVANNHWHDDMYEIGG